MRELSSGLSDFGTWRGGVFKIYGDIWCERVAAGGWIAVEGGILGVLIVFIV